MRVPFLNGFLILSVVAALTAAQSNPTVRVKHGLLSGTWQVSDGGKKYAAFKGVPYARPPIGKYRFREPQALKPWTGVWDATRFHPVCLQYDSINQHITGSESCLYLNVYTSNPSTSANLPVVYYVHGGAFMFGGGSLYDPSYLMNKDIVVVTVNYRLGPLGFLSTGDDVVPGNMGLKDQAFALHWVRENIMMFGGNPDSVTLLGCSAGGASVNYHYLSPLSRGTFARGIALSGASTVPWAQALKPAQKAKTLAGLLGCPNTNSRELVECLRFRPAEAVVQGQMDMMDWKVTLFTPFVPTIEAVGSREPFITQLPHQLGQTGAMARVPLVTSVTAEEGLYPAAWYQRDPTLLSELEARWPDLAAVIFEYNDTLPLTERPAVAQKIKDHYMGGKPISQETYPQLVEAMGDRLFNSYVGKLAQVHAEKSKQPTYVYRYAFRGKVSLTPALSQNFEDYGVSHADDNFHIFKTQFAHLSTPEDMQMTKLLIDMIYNFSTTGVPTMGDAKWTPVTPGSPEVEYLDIKSPSKFEMTSKSNFGNAAFWDSLGFVENENYNVNIKDEL